MHRCIVQLIAAPDFRFRTDQEYKYNIICLCYAPGNVADVGGGAAKHRAEADVLLTNGYFTFFSATLSSRSYNNKLIHNNDFKSTNMLYHPCAMLQAMSLTWEEKLHNTEQKQEDRRHALEKMGISVQSSGIKVGRGVYSFLWTTDIVFSLSPTPHHQKKENGSKTFD